MQELAFMNRLAAVAVPAHCEEWIAHIAAVFPGAEIPVVTIEKARCGEQLTDAFHTYRANLGLVVTFSFRIPESVIAIPSKGFFNVHPGSLPEYRGPDPIFAQIRNQEPFAAVTVHLVDTQWDSGPVIIRERITLLPTDTHGMLSSKLSVVAARLVTNLFKILDFDLPLPAKEQDAKKARYHKKQTAADISINWESMSASAIVALVNACNPWNRGASARIGQKVLKLTEATTGAACGPVAPGTILGFQGVGMVVACRDGISIFVSIVSMDEGIVHASRLEEFGVLPGQQLECV